MKIQYVIGAIAAAFIGSGAQATTLTFDTTADCSTAEVAITAGAAASACGLWPSSPNGTSSLVRSTISNPSDSFWTATFTSLMSMVSIDLGDFNSDPDRLFLSAFDSSDALLGTVTMDIASSSTSMHTLNLAFANISSVTFGVTGDLGRGGMYADNLTFSNDVAPVPLPAGLGLLAAGLFGLGAAGRRRKAAK